MVYVKCRVNGHEFISEEPLCIALEIRKRLENYDTNFLPKVIHWTWSGLVNNYIGSKFDENGVVMEILESEEE